MTNYPITTLLNNLFPLEVEEFTPTIDWFARQHSRPLLDELTLLFAIIDILGIIIFYILSVFGFESKNKVCKQIYKISAILVFVSIISFAILAFIDLSTERKLAKQDLAQFETTAGYVNHDITSITILGKELRVVYDNDQYVDVNFDDETQFIIEDEDAVKYRIDGYFGKEWYNHVEISEETAEKLKVPFDNLTIYLKEE